MSNCDYFEQQSGTKGRWIARRSGATKQGETEVKREEGEQTYAPAHTLTCRGVESGNYRSLASSETVLHLTQQNTSRRITEFQKSS